MENNNNKVNFESTRFGKWWRKAQIGFKRSWYLTRERIKNFNQKNPFTCNCQKGNEKLEEFCHGSVLSDHINIPLAIAFYFLTFGIYAIHWMCTAIQKVSVFTKTNEKNWWKEALLCIFVPFYSIFWFSKNCKKMTEAGKYYGLELKDYSMPCVVFKALFLPVVSWTLMQRNLYIITYAIYVIKNKNYILDDDGREILLKTEHLGIQFGGLKAADDINIKVHKGEMYGLIGPNGAGKTTLFNLITGVYQPTSGTFYLAGEELNGLSPIMINRRGIARTFQNIRLYRNMTVIENVMIGMHNQVSGNIFESIFLMPRHWKNEKTLKKNAKMLLSEVGLYEERYNLSSNLPYGKQRKLEIARALASNPKLLLLDEPAAGMNPSETEDLIRVIKHIKEHFDMTILLIEHDMKFVSGLCDFVTVLNFGTELAEGTVKEVLNNPAVIKAYLGGE